MTHENEYCTTNSGIKIQIAYPHLGGQTQKKRNSRWICVTNNNFKNRAV